MDIILISRRHEGTRTLTLTFRQLLLLAVASLVAIAAASSATSYLLLRHTQPAGAGTVASYTDEGTFVRPVRESADPGDMHGIAARVAEMQTQLVRLDMLSDRLGRLVGFRIDDILGAPETAYGHFDLVPPPVMTLAGLTRQLDLLFRRLDDRREALGALESLFALDNVRRRLQPTGLPLPAAPYSSDFGWRLDPFTGERAYHEGIDFMAAHGTPILAAAGGVVVYSDFHPQYGNMVEIDHGNGLVTRYAHAAKRMAQVGDVVTRGTQIAIVGSTGRSTGNHLHFEVRRNGTPLNPAQFLRLRG